VGVLVGLLLFHAHVDDLLDASVCGDIVGADGHLIEFLFFFFFLIFVLFTLLVQKKTYAIHSGNP